MEIPKYIVFRVDVMKKGTSVELINITDDVEDVILKAEQTEPRKTTDYCDDCNHKGCDNCVADSRDDYCIPSNYQKQTEPQTDCSWR